MPSFLSLLLLALLLGLTAAGSLDRVSIDHDVTTSTYVIRRGDFSSPPIQQDLRLFFKLARINVPEDATAFPEVVHEAYLAEIQKQYPLVPEQLTYVPKAKAAGTYLVQFKTQVLPEYREALAELGAIVRFPFPSQSLLITLKDASRLHEIRNLKVVNWIGDYLPLYKFGADVLHLLAANHLFSGKVHFSVMLVERGAAMQDRIANIIEKELGGEMVLTVPQGFRLEAKLTASQLLQLLAQPEVLYIDVAGQPGTDMNIARISGGLDYISSVAGYNGEGVRAEVMDSGLHVSHGDFKPLNIIIHGGNSLSTSHGSSVFGIVFGAGQVNPKALGALSKAEACIFATYNLISSSYTRYTHTAQLVDPNGPYRAVFQTNSWGNSQTTAYTTLSAEFDDILFINDIAILQSQSNTGNRNSRPEAWAKNIISVGAFYHHDTISKSDDAWDGGASIGPAEDGRQKPDLCNYYDDILTTNASDSGYTQFGGTSGATPITAGHVGIFFQMWADGVFSGRVGQANDVFEVRPHMSTTKAVMINTATQFQFNAESTDLKRVHQGWGVANVATIYDVAMMHGWKFPVLVDETDPITPFEVVSYTVTVHRDDVDTYLKATLVYRDPMPPVSASKQLINNIDLKVTSPSGVVYWGNYGLNEGPCSKPDGAPSSVDNVENVVICLVESGTYTISVHGTEIIEDTYPENSVLDAVYSLVVTKGKNS